MKKCSNIKLNNDEFINRCKDIHGDKYDYSLVEYSNMKNKVKIICPKHGIFEQSPISHLHNKSGCSKCSKNTLNNDEFINKCKEIHGDKYDYSLVKYTNVRGKIKIICPKHGVFEQTASNHIYLKNDCMKCKNENQKLQLNEFIEKSSIKHNFTYDYSLVKYNNVEDKIKIICPKHGIFEQKVCNHIRGIGCKYCSESIGERKIETILNKYNIIFEKQKKFDNCKFKQKLPFDFYLIEYNTCVEYDGIQHFKSIKYFGGDDQLKYTIKMDKIKNNFCNKNNITLIRISYMEKKEIHNILKNKLKLDG